jgi:hypothetical protein
VQDFPPLQEALDLAASVIADISRTDDPQMMLQAYIARAAALMPFDRSVSLSRRGLEAPHYRITRSTLWTDAPDPWTERDKLPLLRAGLLGELLYAGRPRLIDPLVFPADDPAADQLVGMGSLLAIPHFDNGEALNMVVHMRRLPGGFDAARLPELVLLSGLFGQTVHGLITARELREAERSLKMHNLAMTQLSDTVLEQALELKHYNRDLEDRVRARTKDLEEAQLDAITALAVATEEKDEDTGAHIERIRKLATITAAALGLKPQEADALGRAAVLHDVGKLHVPDAILRKPGPLTPDERRVMETHTIAGERILPSRAFYDSARKIARSHHENFDGSGYPDRLSGDAIPREARVVRVVDVYDALVSKRPYKEPWPPPRAIEFLTTQRGHMFDPEILDAFLKTTASGACHES